MIIPIWGTAYPDGHWRVLLDKPPPRAPYTPTIAGKNAVTASDVLIGEDSRS